MKSNAVRLLLVGVNDETGAQLTSLCRRMGHVLRLKNAADASELQQLLSTDSGDLLLLREGAAPLSVDQCHQLLERAGAELPLLLISDKRELASTDSCADVIASGDLQRLAHSCLREFHARQARLALAETQQQLQLAEERNSLLLSQSDEAIAYVADGMIINANDRFAETLGYTKAEELDCASLIDLVHEDDQERVKNALKCQTEAGAEPSQLSVRAITADGASIDSGMTLQHATYDDEPCVQLRLGGSTQLAPQAGSGVDPLTGLMAAAEFIAKLQDVVAHGLGGGSEGSLLLFSLDRFHILRRQLGLNNTLTLVADMAQLIAESLEGAECSRVGDDLIACLLRDTDADSALAKATALCRQLETRIVEIDEQSQQYTASAGVSAITRANAASANALLDNCYGVCEQIRDDAGGSGTGNGAALYVRQRQRLKRSLDVQQLIDEARIDNRLQLLFQPLVSLSDEGGDYYEVLLDLRDREADEIGGMEMLRALDQQADGNTELERWIIVESTKRLADSLRRSPNTRLIINLSCSALLDKTLLPWLGVALKASGLPPQTIGFQFHAASVANNLKAALAFSIQLRELGCQFALCDVGSSSEQLQLLKQLQPPLAKLANSAAQPLTTEELKEAVRAVREQGAKAVVPEVNSASTLAALWQMQPDYIQGSYVHEPGPEMDYEFADIA